MKIFQSSNCLINNKSVTKTNGFYVAVFKYILWQLWVQLWRTLKIRHQKALNGVKDGNHSVVKLDTDENQCHQWPQV